MTAYALPLVGSFKVSADSAGIASREESVAVLRATQHDALATPGGRRNLDLLTGKRTEGIKPTE